MEVENNGIGLIPWRKGLVPNILSKIVVVDMSTEVGGYN